MPRPIRSLLHFWLMALLSAWSAAAALSLPAGEASAQPAAAVGAATGQDAADDGGPVSAQDLQSLVDTIEDEAQRNALLTNLRTLIEARRELADEGRGSPVDTVIGGFLDRLSASAAQVRKGFDVLSDQAAELPDIVEEVVAQASDLDALPRGLMLVAIVAVVVVGGLLAETLVRLALRRPRRATEIQADGGVGLRLVLLIARAAIELVALAAFAGVVYGILTAIAADPDTRLAALTVAQVYVGVRVVSVLARALLAPAAPALRLPPVGDQTARYLYRWIRRFAIVAIVGYFAIAAAAEWGMSVAVYDVLLRLLGLIIAAMALFFIVKIRSPVARAIRGRGEADARPASAWSAFRNRAAAVWHVLAIAYVVAVFVIWAAEVGDGFAFLLRATVLTGVIVVLAAMLQGALVQAVERAFGVGKATATDAPGAPAGSRAALYLSAVAVAVRSVVWIVAAFLVLSAWGIDVFGWWATPQGVELLSAVVSIVVVVAGAVLVWEFATSAIERYLRRRTEEGKATARVRTLLPLARNALLVVLSVMVVLIVLSEIGVDIGPLLAGAGVIGLAVGFGAQKMVQDVITGAFLLFEDALAVGDVVTVAGTGGLVEGLSIRSIRLRDLSGNVHTIPFSSVDQVTNMTKEFSYYLMDIGVAYREDTDYVAQVVKEIIEEMRAEPEYGTVILEPLEVLGVDQFADSAVILKARVKTLPIKQWMVGREFNRRMKKRFDELDIEIPFPHRTLYFGVDRSGQAPAARIHVQAAASGETPAESAPAPTSASTRNQERVGDAVAAAGRTTPRDATTGRGVTSDLPASDQDQDGRT